MILNTDKLVNAEKLLEVLFDDSCRPGIRTLYEWKAKRYLPCIKIGKRVFYDVEQVRQSLAKRHLIRAL